MIFSIFRKEIKLYLLTPISMAIIPAFVALTNFSLYNGIIDYMKITTGGGRRTEGMSAAEFIFPTLFGKIQFILSFMIPLLTMRLIAEEKRLHTQELMMSLPIRPYQYILGKYFAALAFSMTLVLLTIICPLSIAPYSDVQWSVVLISYVGLILYVIFYTAVGTFFSTLTSNQFIACIATIGFSLSLTVVGWLAYIAPVEIEEILSSLLIIQHLKTFFIGYVYLSDVTLFLSGAFLFVYLSQRKVFIEYPANS